MFLKLQLSDTELEKRRFFVECGRILGDECVVEAYFILSDMESPFYNEGKCPKWCTWCFSTGGERKSISDVQPF